MLPVNVSSTGQLPYVAPCRLFTVTATCKKHINGVISSCLLKGRLRLWLWLLLWLLLLLLLSLLLTL